jgi:hypothetical protein
MAITSLQDDTIFNLYQATLRNEIKKQLAASIEPLIEQAASDAMIHLKGHIESHFDNMKGKFLVNIHLDFKK